MRSLTRNQALTLASPFPYVLATVVDGAGRPNVIGLGWWTFTSWEPLNLAIAVGHHRYSHECLEHCKEFVVSFPAADQAKGAWICGTRSGRRGDKVAAAGLTLVPSRHVRPPTIAGATVAFECVVEHQVDSGDHTLYLGRVLAMRGDPERASHLYSIHYEKLVALDHEGHADFALEYE
ncbi:MAG TPA: flavin reductase family protein [Polyangia bacterium]|jgi:flavin reductase (DIM6/NTAB) family NADH-FMN oxidoreductase RutF